MKKNRASICLNMEEDDIKKFDNLCEFLTMEFGFRITRTKALNYLVKRYYNDVIGDNSKNFDEQNELEKNQIRLTF